MLNLECLSPISRFTSFLSSFDISLFFSVCTGGAIIYTLGNNKLCIPNEQWGGMFE